MWRLIAASLGLSWIFHLAAWRSLYIFHGPQGSYFLDIEPPWIPGTAILASSLGLAAALLGLLLLATVPLSSRLRRTGQLLFLVAALVSIWKSLISVVRWLPLSVPPIAALGVYLVCALAAGTVVWLFSYQPDRVYRVAVGCVLVFSPFALISSLQLLLWIASGAPSSDGRTALASRPSRQPLTDRRVVWLLFDELDSVAFSQDLGVDLPAFTRLREEDFSHLSVRPSSDRTVTAIPELTTGRPVADAEPASSDTLVLTRDDARSSWTEEETIFDWAAKRGLSVGIAGWFHPYCRLFADVSVACAMELMGSAASDAKLANMTASSLSFAEALLFQASDEVRLTLANVLLRGQYAPHVVRDQELVWLRSSQIEAFQNLQKAAFAYAADPGLSFVFIHLPVPHPVGIFDRNQRRYSSSNSANYIDNLVLADQTLAALRDELEIAGLADQTALVVSSDHPIRGFWAIHSFWSDEMARLVASRKEQRTPLFVHTPGGRPPEYGGPLEAVVMMDLLKHLLEGKTPQPVDWKRWMAGAEAGRLPRAAPGKLPH